MTFRPYSGVYVHRLRTPGLAALIVTTALACLIGHMAWFFYRMTMAGFTVDRIFSFSLLFVPLAVLIYLVYLASSRVS